MQDVRPIDMAYDLYPNDAARLASGDEQEHRWTKTPTHELAAHPAPGKSMRRVLLFALFWGCTILLTAFVMVVGSVAGSAVGASMLSPASSSPAASPPAPGALWLVPPLLGPSEPYEHSFASSACGLLAAAGMPGMRLEPQS